MSIELFIVKEIITVKCEGEKNVFIVPFALHKLKERDARVNCFRRIFNCSINESKWRKYFKCRIAKNEFNAGKYNSGHNYALSDGVERHLIK